MRAAWLIVAAGLLAAAAPPQKIAPGEIVAAAPASAWKAIPAEDLLVLDLKSGGRVII